MKWNGIKRVYYSDCEGNLCYIKLNQLKNEVDDDSDGEVYASHGLRLMILRCTCMGTLGHKRLPLTRRQKNYIVKHLELSN